MIFIPAIGRYVVAMQVFNKIPAYVVELQIKNYEKNTDKIKSV